MPRTTPSAPPPGPIWSEMIEILSLGLSGRLSPGRELTHLLDRMEATR